jgi:hypothetical protein
MGSTKVDRVLRNLFFLLIACKVLDSHICVAEERVSMWYDVVSVSNGSLPLDRTYCFRLQQPRRFGLFD